MLKVRENMSLFFAKVGEILLTDSLVFNCFFDIEKRLRLASIVTCSF